MVPSKPNEDLFADTTMTFGEHLEELRKYLIRALLGLFIGFVIGLFVSKPVVHGLKEPLRKALQNYFKTRELNKYKEEHKESFAKMSPEEIKLWEKKFHDRKIIPEDIFIDPNQLLRDLNKKHPNIVPGLKPNEQDAERPVRMDDLVEVRIWRSVDEKVRIIGLTAHEAFTIFIKAALITGFVLACPWIFYQIWSFVAAGLYPHERRYIHIYLPFSVILFFMGVSLVFLFVFEPVLAFLLNFNDMLGIEPDPRISSWLGFVLILPLGFGISFQLPLVMLFLYRVGVFTLENYTNKWRMAILVICIISMLLTPADPYSMIAMALPLSVLYLFGILLCKYMPKIRNPFGEPEEEN